ncbi:MAG: TIGR03013 family XrtA/PEP-CTERM system glycosyltransferase [Pseudomonadota bacterium]
MIRIFNHYLHRRTLLHILLDGGLIVFTILAFVITQVDDPYFAMPPAFANGAVLAAYVFVINTASGFYQLVHNRSFIQSCARAVLAMVLVFPLGYLIFSLLPVGVGGSENVKIAAMLGVALVMAHRVYMSHAPANSRIRSKILIFGAGPAARTVGQSLTAADPYVDIVGYLPGPNEQQPAIFGDELLPTHRSLTETALRLDVDEIVVALTERRGGSMPLRELLDCKLNGIRVYDIATHFEKTLGQIKIDYVYAGWLIFGDGFSQGALRTAVKRCFDIVCSWLLLLVFMPVMLVTALLIWMESRGSIFYRQERVGLNGKIFNVIKFRSMIADAEKDGQPRWATVGDDRVTSVGRVIRKLRIDELPQLYCVLKGDMSLVGPRPERPYFVEQLTEQIPYYSVRQSVKPGVTGWAQVRYHYGATVADSQEKLNYDLYYVKNHTLFLDLVILFETVAVVLMAKGSR